MGREVAKELIQYIKNRPYLPYAALLDIAHADGLQSISAEFITVTESLATAKATVKFKDGRIFTESGEATPTNVTSYVRPAFARMALTRAKGRALRDALNVDLMTAEELSDTDGSHVTDENMPPDTPASQDRIDYLSYLLQERGVDESHTTMLIEVLTSTGEPMARVVEAAINRVGQAYRLPDGWFRSYVKMLRELKGIDQSAVVAFLADRYQKDTPNALTPDEQRELINWLHADHSVAPTEDGSPDAVSEVTFDWVALIDSISTHTGHEHTDVEHWILATYGQNGQEITDLPESSVDQIANMDIKEIGRLVDVYMGESQ